ncbi:MAG: hypothetical protein IPM82_12380 [Saprospiraceae bacterium]|nr:hypothetical protein [Saprospiraceae bacterium]
MAFGNVFWKLDIELAGCNFLSDMDDLIFGDEPGSIKKSGNIYIFAGSAKSWNVFQWAMVSPAFKPIFLSLKFKINGNPMAILL